MYKKKLYYIIVSDVEKEKGNDEKWGHAGFVTYKASKLESHNTYGEGVKQYYDLMIAQHTSDYYYWTSHRENGWDLETKETGNYKPYYAVLKRNR